MTVRKARTASFYIDIEKNGFLDDDDIAYKQQLEKQLQLHQQRGGGGGGGGSGSNGKGRKGESITLTILVLCILSLTYFIYGYGSTILMNNNLQLDKSILLSSGLGSPEISILTQELINNYDEMNNGGIGLMVSDELKEELKQQQQYYSQPKVANILSSNDGTTKQENQGYPATNNNNQDNDNDNEDEDYNRKTLNNINEINSKINNNFEDDNDNDNDTQNGNYNDVETIQANLKEMFAISPMVVLSPTNQIDELQTILTKLNINPQPKFINLSKHPNYLNIKQYLKKIYNIDEDDHIPKVFLGGIPIGDSNKIIEMYKENQLISHLREKGQGLINI
ncbi:conserved hypothetical protein [Candida dubliniensis CD36]|uniref:Uncharacterized protein n=1 Tax=Candida dubliniensis (strain CD36 / ATCC MYA-646 / CBS 7987 / NCPF 3949 / NRRL Y-17841) TaxID=573826 RepID=B9WCA3_CANDC|nr:conserved hypothetical protein [Candida dubliniensis CD36]CAX44025.1 conserved hypothetical protein [Candida dubliniensis CD36]